jgi:formylglycine-generating enzyme required for sulfatase activity
MVSAGAVCIDKYEVSVWDAPTGGNQLGVTGDDYSCDDNGSGCADIYARSVAGVTPSAYITWFQAQQALANVGKRLPTNAEWQQAATETPDTGVSDNGTSDCRTNSGGSAVATGSRSACVSRFGANDMAGNLWEWVGDWDEEASIGACNTWPTVDFGTDTACVGRGMEAGSSRFPGALIRGGGFISSTGAGAFAVVGTVKPSFSDNATGFRGAR